MQGASNQSHEQMTLTYFVMGIITLRLTSCLTGLDFVVLNNINRFTCLTKSKPVKREVSHTVILPLTM